MSVDATGQNDLAAGVDDLRPAPSAGLDAVEDPAIRHQHVGGFDRVGPHHGAAGDDEIRRHRSISREMTMRRISEVPPPISASLESRKWRCMSNSIR